MYCDERDMLSILNTESIEWGKFRNKTILVTGATGLIGTTIVKALLFADKKLNLNLRTVCIVRDKDKARRRFGGEAFYYLNDLNEKITIDENIDFIIHAASPTSSSFFVNNPVETIKATVVSTMSLLELAKDKMVDGFVYLSSMEVYGYPTDDHSVKEHEVAGFDTMVTRNSYTIGKQMCEMLCKSYQSEYSIPAKVIRLTQTFGPGVEYDDGRVFADFMRCAIENRDIILHTEGKTERCYLYTADAASAVLTVLTKGKAGEVYTAANPDTYCSIFEMAQLVADSVALGGIDVRVELDTSDRGYRPELHLKLDTEKIEGLGWKPRVGLTDMYKRMIDSVKTSSCEGK